MKISNLESVNSLARENRGIDSSLEAMEKSQKPQINVAVYPAQDNGFIVISFSYSTIKDAILAQKAVNNEALVALGVEIE